MFQQMLGRSIKFGEEVAHIFTAITLDPVKWEQLGIEIIKDAAFIKDQIKASQEAQEKKQQAEAQPADPAAPAETEIAHVVTDSPV